MIPMSNESNQAGLLLVLSGPSGAGKSTLLNYVMAKRNDMFFSVSATTREPRPYEKSGEHYFFHTRDSFETLIKEDKLLEWAEYAGNLYGTPAQPVFDSLSKGKIVVLDIEVKGALDVIRRAPWAVSVYVTPSSPDEVERRLRGRGTETEAKLRERMQITLSEYQYIDKYSYLIVNDTIDGAAARLEAILLAERCKTARNTGILSEFRNG